jgi:hypothetical protein
MVLILEKSMKSMQKFLLLIKLNPAKTEFLQLANEDN